jgi:dihydroflavonol-4-reductase
MILITGATGLVGANLAMQLLEKETSVRCIYRKKENQLKTKALFELHKKSQLFSKIDWIQADILDVPALEIAFEDVVYVYHCAALVSFDPADEQKLRKTNIEGTANIVNLCIAKNIKKICHVSSIAALGDKKEHETFIDENSDWNPEKNHSDYAISKYGAEMEVWRGYQEGLPVVVVNPGVILGSGFSDSWSISIFSAVKKGLPFYTSGSTGFIGVIDLVVVMQSLMESSISGERFCIVSENKNFQELTATIAACYKVKKPSFYMPKNLSYIGAFLDRVLSILNIRKSNFSKQIAIAAHTKDLFSNQKTIETLDFKFTPINSVIATIIQQNNSI